MVISVSILAAGAAALLATAPVAVSQSGEQQAVASPTATDGTTRALIDALNGNPASRFQFARDGFSSDALKAEGSDSRARWLNKIASDSRGFTLVSYSRPGERMVEAVLRSNRGGRFGRLVIFTSKSEPGKISDLFLLAARNPEKARAESWPTGPLPISRIAAAIEQRAASLAQEDHFSGVILVAKGDRVIVRRAYGFADLQWKIRNRIDTAFHTGSVGKMFTAAAILRLASQGRLSLDDSAAKWVPEFQNPESSKITLRRLLSHSSGLADWDIRHKESMTGAEAAARMNMPLRFVPGSKFEYSNGGFVLLGAVIEKETGKPFPDALRELIFEPAGMRGAGVWPVTAVVPNRATGYRYPPDDPLGIGPRYSNEQFLGYAGDGSGGVYATADDLFSFSQALAGNRLLDAAHTKEMLEPRFDFAGGPRPSKYGYGIELGDCRGVGTFGHGGGGPNSGVDAVSLRTVSGWTIVVLSNYDPPAADELAHSVCEFVANR